MKQLWAPWRLKYVASGIKNDGCFLCNAWQDTDNDKEHLLLTREEDFFVIMNRYPYSSGHLMVCPSAHIGDLSDISGDGAAKLWQMVTLCRDVLADEMSPDGFNIGINLGECAGAGVPGHLHIHIVPRWEGDNNFMPVLGDVKVIPQMLSDGYDALKIRFDERGV